MVIGDRLIGSVIGFLKKLVIGSVIGIGFFFCDRDITIEEQHNPVPEILDEFIEVPRIIITHAQGMKHMGDLEHYAICSDGDDSKELHAAILQVQYLMMRRYPKQKQTTMQQYFR